MAEVLPGCLLNNYEVMDNIIKDDFDRAKHESSFNLPKLEGYVNTIVSDAEFNIIISGIAHLHKNAEEVKQILSELKNGDIVRIERVSKPLASFKISDLHSFDDLTIHP